MNSSSSALADSTPDPEELPADAASFPFGIAALGFLAYYFANVLPYWKPLTWWLLVAVSGVLRLWTIRRLPFDTMPERKRRWLLRGLIWSFMAANSSVAYFLYVPGDTVLHALLTVYLLGIATVLIAHLSGVDKLRILVALLILGVPTGLRLVIEGWTSGVTATWILGCSTLFVPIPLAQIAAVQMRLMRRQVLARLQAENATRAMSEITLAKSRFFAAISHDLRQPVHAIGLYLDAIERVVAQSHNPQARQAVLGITLSWQTLNDLLSQVLDLARLEADMEQAVPRPLPLLPLLTELVVQHSSLAEGRGVRLVVMAKAQHIVYADELMLKRVLSNLLGNALKYSPPGRAVALAVRRAGGCWRIEVRDAGCGIAEQHHAQIFSEFVQVDNEARASSAGFGLGLAIAKRLTELLGGTIDVRSRLGWGCSMAVTLPRWQGEPEPAAPVSAATDAAPPLRGLRGLPVLLVEDDPLVGSAMVQLLQAWGGEVHWAKTASSAKQYTNQCRLAICDVRLPEQASGLELASWLQALGLRVMLISGETDLASRSYAEQHGLPLLTKPVAPLALRRAVEAFVAASPAPS